MAGMRKGYMALQPLCSPPAAQADEQPVAWVRWCSDSTFEGPLMDFDRRMDDVRKKSGAWTPLFAAAPP
ncbi:hypothetical protein QM294_17425, partial [Acinetobacter junii]|uniref:hypothetical protein n=1 Tax=Acinetobacter junii TaxID=40215 RepID=UPI0024B7C7D0